MGHSEVFFPLADHVIAVHHVAPPGICSMQSYPKPSWSSIVPSSSSSARQSVEDANNVCVNNFPFLSNMTLPIKKLSACSCNRMSQTATRHRQCDYGVRHFGSVLQTQSQAEKAADGKKCSPLNSADSKSLRSHDQTTKSIRYRVKRSGLVTNPNWISSNVNLMFFLAKVFFRWQRLSCKRRLSLQFTWPQSQLVIDNSIL